MTTGCDLSGKPVLVLLTDGADRGCSKRIHRQFRDLCSRTITGGRNYYAYPTSDEDDVLHAIQLVRSLHVDSVYVLGAHLTEGALAVRKEADRCGVPFDSGSARPRIAIVA